MIEEAHATHIDIARMKSLTHQFFWWPKIDSDLESKVRNCGTCQKFKGEPPQAVLPEKFAMMAVASLAWPNHR